MKKFRAVSTIISGENEDKWIIIETNNNYYRELNEAAGVIWSALKTPKSVDELIGAVLFKFDTDFKTAKKDVLSFVKKYLQEGLIEEVL